MASRHTQAIVANGSLDSSKLLTTIRKGVEASHGTSYASHSFASQGAPRLTPPEPRFPPPKPHTSTRSHRPRHLHPHAGMRQAAPSAFPGVATAAEEGLGTAAKPVYMQMLEPTFKAQLWRTLRTLGATFVFLSCIGALMEDRGGLTKGIMGGGSSEPKMSTEGNTRFADVKGVDEAKSELEEIVQYLKARAPRWPLEPTPSLLFLPHLLVLSAALAGAAHASMRRRGNVVKQP